MMSLTLPQALALFQMQEPKEEQANAIYRQMARSLHPDKGGNAHVFKLMTEAKSVIMQAAVVSNLTPEPQDHPSSSAQMPVDPWDVGASTPVPEPAMPTPTPVQGLVDPWSSATVQEPAPSSTAYAPPLPCSRTHGGPMPIDPWDVSASVPVPELHHPEPILQEVSAYYRENRAVWEVCCAHCGDWRSKPAYTRKEWSAAWMRRAVCNVCRDMFDGHQTYVAACEGSFR